MIKLNGKTVVPGLAIGNICTLFDEEERKIPHYRIPENRIRSEIKRARSSIEEAKSEMRKYINKSDSNQDGTASKIFDSHLMILKDQSLFEKIQEDIENRQVNAEHAIYDAFDEYIELYQNKNLHFKELVHDFKDVRDNLLEKFDNKEAKNSCPLPDRSPVIIAAKRLSPYMMNDLTQDNILGFVTEEGGFTTHASVLAASMDIPFMFNVPVSEYCRCNDRAILDAVNQEFILHPNPDTIEQYEKKSEAYQRKVDKYKEIASQPAYTRDKKRINLTVSINLPNEIELLDDYNFDGVGLLRTEFLFMKQDEPPTEEEQLNIYKLAAQASGENPVSIRLLDIGADKTPHYLDLPEQNNPDLGIKGARSLNYFRDIFKTQIGALLKAAKYGNIRILLPMISDISDINHFKEVIRERKQEIEKQEGITLPETDIGAMIETPAAAMLTEEIAENVDFINIGSNDLLQYTIAASRENPEIYEKYHSLHPSLIKLLDKIVKGTRDKDIEVSLCGEIANFEEAYPLFLDLGLTSYSVPVSKHSLIKHELSRIDTKEIEGIKEKFMRSRYSDEIDELLNKM